MRYIPALLLLASCQSWGWSDTADALLPDEFTLAYLAHPISQVGQRHE